MIVTVPVSPVRATEAAERTTRKISSGSFVLSPLIVTLMAFVVTPGVKVSVPEALW